MFWSFQQYFLFSYRKLYIFCSFFLSAFITLAWYNKYILFVLLKTDIFLWFFNWVRHKQQLGCLFADAVVSIKPNNWHQKKSSRQFSNFYIFTIYGAQQLFDRTRHIHIYTDKHHQTEHIVGLLTENIRVQETRSLTLSLFSCQSCAVGQKTENSFSFHVAFFCF